MNTFTNETEMVNFLKNNGTQCRYVSMTIETPVVKMQVKSPYTGVMKVSKKTGWININYNKAVVKRIAKMISGSIADITYNNGEVWYKHLKASNGKNLPVCVHATKENGKHYLQFFPMKSTHKYVMPDGTVVAEADLKPWLYKEAPRKAFKPTVMVVGTENIKQLKASKVVMETVDFEQVSAVLVNS